MCSASSSDAPTSRPMAAKKVKAMAPPMSRTSALSASERSTPSLSWTLPPPTTATKGRAGLTSRPPSTSTSSASRMPAALGRRRRGADQRGVRPMGDAEGLVHVGVEAPHQAVDERGVVGLLARIEPQVLEQGDVGGEDAQRPADGLHRAALGPVLGRAPEVGGGRDAGPAPLQPFDRRQGGADPEVVHDVAGTVGVGLDGDVEVGPHEDGRAVEGPQVLQEGHPDERRTDASGHRAAPMISTRSTRRLE